MPSHSLSMSQRLSGPEKAGLSPPKTASQTSIYKHKKYYQQHHRKGTKERKHLGPTIAKHREAIGLLGWVRRQKAEMTSLSEFSRETSLHGWKFAMQAQGFFHRAVWFILILSGIGLAIYQIVTKVRTYAAEPLSVNIEISYNESLTFPTLTICSTLDAKVSWLMEKHNQFLINKTEEMYRHAQPTVNNDESYLDRINTTLEGFLRASQLAASELFLWCRTPLKKECTTADFVPVWTDDGLCFKIDIGEKLVTAGPDYTLELIIDAATYEAIPGFPSAGLRMAVHPSGSMAVMSDAAFDIAAGTLTMVGLNVRKTTRISRDEHRCRSGDEAQLDFFPGYSYVACTLEGKFRRAMESCECTPPLLVEYQRKGDPLLESSRCSLSQYFQCLRPSTGPSALTETQARALFGENYTSKSPEAEVDARNCEPSCTSMDYAKEFSFTIFRDDLLLRNLLNKQNGSKESVVRQRYQRAKDGQALFTLKSPTTDTTPLKRASQAFQTHVLEPAMTPTEDNKESENVAKKLITLNPCLNYSSFLEHNSDEGTNAQISEVDEMFGLVEAGFELAELMGAKCPSKAGGRILEVVTSEERQLASLALSMGTLTEEQDKFAKALASVRRPAKWEGQLPVDAWRLDPDACFCNVTVFGSVTCYCNVDNLQRKVISTFKEVQSLFESLAVTVTQVGERSRKNDPIPVLTFAHIRDSADSLIRSARVYFDEAAKDFAQAEQILRDIVRFLVKNDASNGWRLRNKAQGVLNPWTAHQRTRLTKCARVIDDLERFQASTMDMFSADEFGLAKAMGGNYSRIRRDFEARCTGMDGEELAFDGQTREGRPPAWLTNGTRVGYRRLLAKALCYSAQDLRNEVNRLNVTLEADRVLAKWRMYAVGGGEKAKQFYDIGALETSLTALKDIDKKLKEYQREEISKSELNTFIKRQRKLFYDSVATFEKAVTDAIDILDRDRESVMESPQTKSYLDDMGAQSKAHTKSQNMTLEKIACLRSSEEHIKGLRSEQKDEHGYYMVTTMNELFAELQEYDLEMIHLSRFYKENMAYVKLFYKSMAVQHTIQSRTYDFWSFLCDTGGTLGLFLGASLLTLFECVELLFLRAFDAMGVRSAKAAAKAQATADVSSVPNPTPTIVFTKSSAEPPGKVPNGNTYNTPGQQKKAKH